jgi:hypothetical protein
MYQNTEDTKKILKDKNIPFEGINEYVLVKKDLGIDLTLYFDAEILVENDPEKTLILPYIFDVECEIYSALQFCGLSFGE